jgi:hypothetical protein
VPQDCRREVGTRTHSVQISPHSPAKNPIVSIIRVCRHSAIQLRTSVVAGSAGIFYFCFDRFRDCEVALCEARTPDTGRKMYLEGRRNLVKVEHRCQMLGVAQSL